MAWKMMLVAMVVICTFATQAVAEDVVIISQNGRGLTSHTNEFLATGKEGDFGETKAVQEVIVGSERSQSPVRLLNLSTKRKLYDHCTTYVDCPYNTACPVLYDTIVCMCNLDLNNPWVIIGGGAAAGRGGATATTALASVEPAKERVNVEENKKEDKEEMSEDDDMIMDLFGDDKS